MTVETRAIRGSDVKEVRAAGMIAAPPHVLRAVIADVGAYAAFMPYGKESRSSDAAPKLLASVAAAARGSPYSAARRPAMAPDHREPPDALEGCAEGR